MENYMRILLLILFFQAFLNADHIWFEGENFKETNFPEKSWFSPQNADEKDALSGGNWLSSDIKREGPALYVKYEITAKEDNTYDFWVRKFYTHGPFKWRFNAGEWQICGKNVPLADSTELRKFVCANWVFLGKTGLKKGVNLLELELLAEEGEETTSAFDCFILTTFPFIPNGKNKPGEKYGNTAAGYFAFEPEPDRFAKSALLDLRHLNEPEAGSKGFLKVKGNSFVFEKDTTPVKFWGVVAGENTVTRDQASVKYLAKRLAKLGINIIRVHSALFDKNAKDPAQIDRAYLDKLHFFAAAMKKEGIYIKLSFYYPLWFNIKPEYGLPGYENLKNKLPFSLLFFYPRMQELYRSWAKSLLTTVNPYTKLAFADDPAVALVEIVNEDNYFFWTFNPYETIPAECMAVLEQKYFAWLAKKYGSFEKVKAAWSPGENIKGDVFFEKRAGLYPVWFLTAGAKGSRNDRRAFDQAEFLTLELRNFFRETRDWLKKDLGVKCPVSATNWTTADNNTLGLLDKYAAMACDVMDRHVYFDPKHKTDRNYTLSAGDSYTDTTVLTDPCNQLLQEREYDGRPNIVSEICWDMPNRFRAEGPVLMAACGSLQGTDAFFQFAVNSTEWESRLTKWPAFTPETLGQSPACSLIFRKGYIKEGGFSAVYNYELKELFQLKGNIPGRAEKSGNTPNSLPGKTGVTITTLPGRVIFAPENNNISGLTGELDWDHKNGLVRINAPCVEGAAGFLAKAGELKFSDLSINSKNEYGCILAVSIDGKDLKNSGKILLQLMTEDMNTGWQATGAKIKKIVTTGKPPILVKEFAGTISFRTAGPGTLKIKALDLNGYLKKEIPLTAAGEKTFELLPDCMYYIIEK